MKHIWQTVAVTAVVWGALTGGAYADEIGGSANSGADDNQSFKYELKIEQPQSGYTPIYYNKAQQTFFRPSVTFTKVYDLKAFANTVPGVLAKFAAIGNERSTEVWHIITAESQQYIVNTMVEAWHKNNPDEKVESEDKLKENVRNLFDEGDNQMAKLFWEAYFGLIFGDMEYTIDLSKLSFKGDADKEVVTIGSRTFVLIKEKSQWKIDLVNSKLELEQ